MRLMPIYEITDKNLHIQTRLNNLLVRLIQVRMSVIKAFKDKLPDTQLVFGFICSYENINSYNETFKANVLETVNTYTIQIGNARSVICNLIIAFTDDKIQILSDANGSEDLQIIISMIRDNIYNMDWLGWETIEDQKRQFIKKLGTEQINDETHFDAFMSQKINFN